MADEALITREELTGTLFRINDIANEVQRIRELLEEDDGEEPEAGS